MAQTTRNAESMTPGSETPVLKAPVSEATSRIPHLVAPRTHRGFTLVELLVVVSIIALLISILLPSLKQAREQAKSVKCLAHSRGLGQAAMSFAADHNGRMQVSTSQVGMENSKVDPDYSKFAYGTVGQSGSPQKELLSWPVALAQASGITMPDNWDWGVRATGFQDAQELDKEGRVSEEFELALCPSDRIKLSTPEYPQSFQLIGSGDPDYEVPAADGMRYWGRLSYGINEDIVGADLHPNGTSREQGPSCWKADSVRGAENHKGEWGDQKAGRRLQGRLDRIFDPATVLLMVDAGADAVDPDGNPTNLIISAQAKGPFLEDFQARWGTRLPEKRHPKGQLNVTYADGHGAPTRPVGKVQYGRLPIFYPERYSNVTRVSPYPPHNLPGSPAATAGAAGS